MELRQALFWDVRPENIDIDKNSSYVVERVLEHGNDTDVRQLLHTYSTGVIRRTLEKSRLLRPRTKALWNLMTLKK